MKIFEYNEAKQVVVCGDIHGAFETMVFKTCVQYGMTDTLVIVAGDCGFGFERPNHYINLYNGLAGRLKKANNWIVLVICIRYHKGLKSTQELMNELFEIFE